MKTKLFVCLIFACLIVSNKPKAQVNIGDSLALVDLYNSTDGPNWVYHTNWLTSKPVRTWDGITVRGTRVVYIYMYQNGLAGSLPASILNLDSLIEFQASVNQISGSLPDSIGKLTHIRHINFMLNQLSGAIPVSIGTIAGLVELNLGDNLLEGTIPSSLGNCKHLQYLMLNNNQIIGKLPPSVCRLKKLKFLDVSYNQLSGPLPDNFETGSLLYEFDITSNQISGTIPASLSNLGELQYLDLPSNQLSGTIPPQLANLTKLDRLSLANNQLTGSVPPSFKNFTHLGNFNLSNNHLQEDKFIPLDGNRYYFTCYIEENSFNFNLPEYLIQEDISVNYWPQTNIAIHLFDGKLALSAGGTLQNNTYVWRKIGSKEKWTIAADSVFQPDVNGRYYAQVTNAIATHLTLYTDTVTYTVPLKNELNISLSPNPAKDRITIHGLNEKSSANITIADMSGFVWVKVFSRQQLALEIDVSRLKVGNYLLNVSDGKEVKTIQFVKE